MNLLRFLKSTQGAIKVSNALFLSVAAGAGFYFIANTASQHQIEAQRQLRSLSSIEQTSASARMRQGGRAGSAISVADGGRLATADERAAMHGSNPLETYYKNQAVLNNLDSNLGRAATVGGSELDMGNDNQKVGMAPVRLSVGNPNAGAVGAAAGVQVSQAGGQQAASTSARSSAGGNGQFASASMARASGGAFSGTSGPVSGSSTGGVAGGISGREGPARLSGSMPGGNNIMTKMGLERASRTGTSSFSDDRKATIGHARNARRGQNEIDDVLKLTAKAAANSHASANEAGRAFFASAKSSGGMSVEGGTDVGYSTSADLAAPTAAKLKAIGNRLNQEEDKQEERNRKHRQLIAQLIITAVLSAGLIIGAAKWLRKLDIMIAAATPITKAALTIKRWIIAAAMVAAVAAGNLFLFIKAKEFESNYGAYGGTWVATVARIVSVLTVAAAVQTMFTPDWKGFIKTAWAKVKSGLSSVALGAATRM